MTTLFTVPSSLSAWSGFRRSANLPVTDDEPLTPETNALLDTSKIKHSGTQFVHNFAQRVKSKILDIHKKWKGERAAFTTTTEDLERLLAQKEMELQQLRAQRSQLLAQIVLLEMRLTSDLPPSSSASVDALTAPPVIQDGAPQPAPNNVQRNLKLKAGRKELSRETLMHDRIEDRRKRRREEATEVAAEQRREHERHNDEECYRVAKMILDAIKDHGTIFHPVNQNQLSVHAGLYFEDLKSTSLVSLRKLPMVMETVLTLFFGHTIISTLKTLESAICPSFQTISRAILRSSLAVKERNAGRFALSTVEAKRTEVFVAVSLCMDDANKSDHQIKNKLGFGIYECEKVERISFDSDMVVSKKTTENTFQSLLSELGGHGISLIHSICSDWFASGGEGKKLLQLIDTHTVQMQGVEKDFFLTRRSKVNPAVLYDYSGRFRESCIRPCLAHSSQSIIKPVLTEFSERSGLKHDATTSQGCYRVHYYLKKYHDLYRAVLINLFVDGDPDRHQEIPPILWNILPDNAQSRWVAAEKQAKLLAEAMLLPASPALIAKFNTLYNPEAAHAVYEQCQTFLKAPTNTSNCPSAFYLVLYRLAHGAPGGTSGDLYQNIMLILGFLRCPFHQASICIVRAMLPLSLRFLDFANGESCLGKTKYMSLRMLEHPVFAHSMLETIVAAAHSWSSVFPELRQQLTLIFQSSPVEDFEQINSKLDRACKAMMSKALEYLRDVEIGIGYSFSLIMNPVLADTVVQGWVEGLRYHGIVNVDTNMCVRSILSAVTPLAQHGPILAVANVQPWTANSASHAYPNMTFHQLRLHIVRSLVDAGRDVALAHAKRLGLMNEQVLMELQEIGTGRWKQYLASCTHWKVGEPVKSFYTEHFVKKFPLLSEALTYCFGSMSITTTAVECSFSAIKNVIDPSSCWQTVRDDNHHFLDVRGNIVHDMDNVIHHKDGTVTKQYNFSDTAEGRSSYLKALEERGDILESSARNQPWHSTAQLATMSGRTHDISAVHQQAQRELEANRTNKPPISSMLIQRTTDKMTIAKRNGDDALKETDEEIFDKMVHGILKPARVELLVRYKYADLTKQQLNRCTKDDLTPMIKDLLINIDPHAADKNERGEYILLKNN